MSTINLLLLITEALVPGYTIMALGQDHFVTNDPEIDLKTAALLPVMLKLIEGAESEPESEGQSLASLSVLPE